MSNDPPPNPSAASTEAAEESGEDGPIKPAPRRGRGLAIGAAGAVTILLTMGVFFGIKLLGGDDGAEAGGPDENKPKATDEITQFDFANATIDNGSGQEQTLKDGTYTLPGYDAELGVGTAMTEGPVFADVDEDGDLDAAVTYRWTPAAGTPTTIAFIWEWTGGTAEQIVQPIMAGYDGNVTDLAASGNEFTIVMTSNSPSPANDTETERVSVSVRDGYVAQTRPHFGAVDRCVVFDENQELGTVDNDTSAYVAADPKSPKISPDAPFTQVLAIKRDVTPKGRNMARLTSADGSVRCGWISDDAVTQ